MAERARTVSVAQLSAVAHRAAKAALSQSKTLQAQQPERGIVVRPPWIMGIIFRNADPQNLAEYQHVASRVAEQVEKDTAAGSIAGGAVQDAAIYSHDRIVICGFLPPPEDIFTLE